MKDKGTHHETVIEHRIVANTGSDRSFGIVFTVVFIFIGFWPMISGGSPRLWAVFIAVGFIGAAFFAPRLLSPLNQGWFRFGQLLHKIVTPVVLGLIYVTTIVPIGFLMKAAGKDPLRRKFDPDSASYWIVRDPPGPDSESLPRQF